MPDGIPVLEPMDAYALWAGSYPPEAHNPVMLAEERAMLALLPADLAGARVLDAGCGSGRYLRHAVDRGAKSPVGVDFSEPMLRRGSGLLPVDTTLACGALTSLPVRSGWADVTICALAVGHLPDLAKPVVELARVTKPGGLILCSDFHPIGATLGWKRDFKADGRKYAIRYTTHTIDRWHEVCAESGLTIENIVEARLDPADIPAGARFDPIALEVPVVLVVGMKRKL